MTEYVQVVTTTDSKNQAATMAQRLVESRLAACAQIIGPISSTYWWKGKIETDNEWMCIFKTRNDLYQDLERVIREIHPYEVPEIIAIPIVTASNAYLDWLGKELRPRSG